MKVAGERVVLLNEHSWTDLPEQSWDSYMPNSRFRMPKASQITATRVDNQWYLDMQVQKVQPKTASFVIGRLYVGAKASGDILFEGKISADNLPQPLPCELKVQFLSETRSVTLADIQEFERQRFLASPQYRRFLEQRAKK